MKSDNLQMSNISTPAYVFDSEIVQKNYNTLQEKMKNYSIHYALKANSEYIVLNALNAINANFEVASLNELLRLKELNVSDDRIICSRPVIGYDEVESMYQNGCRYFVYDTLEQLEILNKYAYYSLKIARINVNDIDKNEIEFGMELSQLNSVEELDGLTFYMKNPNIEKTKKIFEKIDEVLSDKDIEGNFVINIGGGYGPNLSTEYFDFLYELSIRLCEKYTNILFRFLAEPGEHIVKDAGSIISRVIAIKEKEKLSYVYIDAGTPAGLFNYYGVVSVLNAQNKNKAKRIYAFFDTTCAHKRICVNALTDEINVGDIISIPNCGGYMSCYTNRFHLFEQPVMLERKELR